MSHASSLLLHHPFVVQSLLSLSIRVIANPTSALDPVYSGSMPVYLVHGFRWPRSAIRIFIILNNIDEAAPEWIVGPTTSAALRDSLETCYPNIMRSLPNLRFVEQYDPSDESGVNALSQPFAFVADRVEECTLSLDVSESMKKGIDSNKWDALMDLKEELAPKEKLGWYMVFNGDEMRVHQSNDSTHPAAQVAAERAVGVSSMQENMRDAMSKR